MANLFSFPQLSPSSFSVILDLNKKVIGELYMEIDGYYVFLASKGNGYWDEYSLHEIANKLTSLNKDWDVYVKNDLEKLNR